MPLLNTIAELLDWILHTYGPDIMKVAVRSLRNFWYRHFANRNILVFGAKATGKSSLILFMQRGKPYELVRGEIHPPDPTAAAVLIGKKVPLEDRTQAKIDSDVGGDPEFRGEWKRLIEKVHPDGIVYMLDGRLDEEGMQSAVAELFDDVLVYYADSLKGLAALHIFLNFSDEWLTTPESERVKLDQVKNLFEERRGRVLRLTRLRLGVSATQLAPNQTSWNQAKRALLHFAADLTT